MNSDDFEQYLQRQPIRPVPTEWRREILSAVAAVPPNNAADKPLWRFRVVDLVTASTPKLGWREWFWPSPAAWATLATVWLVICTGLVIVVTHLTASETPAIAASKTPLPAPQILTMVVENRQLIEKLKLMDVAPVPNDTSSTMPGPQSERRATFTVT